MIKEPESDTVKTKVENEISWFKEGDEIDAWGMGRVVREPAISCEQVLDKMVALGKLEKNGSYYGLPKGTKR